MAWTFDEKSPIYLQIAYRVKLKIASKELSMGQQLLPVREFAQEAGVNPNTVQRAFQELEKEGLVYSARTSGRFVTEDYAKKHPKTTVTETIKPTKSSKK